MVHCLCASFMKYNVDIQGNVLETNFQTFLLTQQSVCCLSWTCFWKKATTKGFIDTYWTGPLAIWTTTEAILTHRLSELD